MQDVNIQRIKSIKDLANDEVEVVIVVNKKELADKFVPYYNIQEDLRKALLPVLLEEILKSKDEIVKKVLLNVDWTEIVRSEVAQRVIQEIARKSNF